MNSESRHQFQQLHGEMISLLESMARIYEGYAVFTPDLRKAGILYICTGEAPDPETPFIPVPQEPSTCPDNDEEIQVTVTRQEWAELRILRLARETGEAFLSFPAVASFSDVRGYVIQAPSSLLQTVPRRLSAEEDTGQ